MTVQSTPFGQPAWLQTLPFVLSVADGEPKVLPSVLPGCGKRLDLEEFEESTHKDIGSQRQE